VLLANTHALLLATERWTFLLRIISTIIVCFVVLDSGLLTVVALSPNNRYFSSVTRIKVSSGTHEGPGE